jgi:hypothetical protein
MQTIVGGLSKIRTVHEMDKMYRFCKGNGATGGTLNWRRLKGFE